jgi:hypothetical protein
VRWTVEVGDRAVVVVAPLVGVVSVVVAAVVGVALVVRVPDVVFAPAPPPCLVAFVELCAGAMVGSVTTTVFVAEEPHAVSMNVSVRTASVTGSKVAGILMITPP